MSTLICAAPTFLVPDVASTAQWYEANLGFQPSFHPKSEPYVYASLRRDGVEIMLLRLEGYLKLKVERAGGVWDAYVRSPTEMWSSRSRTRTDTFWFSANC